MNSETTSSFDPQVCLRNISALSWPPLTALMLDLLQDIKQDQLREKNILFTMFS